MYSNSLHDHVGHLRFNHLFANIDKCTFYVDSILFLVFMVNKNGVHVDPEEIKAIQE